MVKLLFYFLVLSLDFLMYYLIWKYTKTNFAFLSISAIYCGFSYLVGKEIKQASDRYFDKNNLSV